MYNENDINNFEKLFRDYENLHNQIVYKASLTNNDWLEVKTQYMLFNTKLRMPFAIENIELRNIFLDEKVEIMKMCHLMIYKFNDLWFAYEALLNLYNIFYNTKIGDSGDLNKYSWLDKPKYKLLIDNSITNAISHFNSEINDKFRDNLVELKHYVEYCKSSSHGKKLPESLDKVLQKIDVQNNNLSDFDIKNILSLSYAIRNNIVHNGEITLNNIDYRKKKELLIVLYEFLAILILSITIQVVEKKLESI